jgi:hypothetical protein
MSVSKKFLRHRKRLLEISEIQENRWCLLLFIRKPIVVSFLLNHTNQDPMFAFDL